jgi:hypothetical protein
VAGEITANRPPVQRRGNHTFRKGVRHSAQRESGCAQARDCQKPRRDISAGGQSFGTLAGEGETVPLNAYLILSARYHPTATKRARKGLSSSQTKRPPEGDLAQHQVSVRREAVHIRASRFKLVKTMQIFFCVGTKREASPQESDDSCFRGCGSIRRRVRHTQVSLDRSVRRTRFYALIAGAPHRRRRK